MTLDLSPAALRISRAAFLVRLAALLAAMVASIGEPLTLVFVLGAAVVAGSSYLGLAHPEVLALVARHPLLGMADMVVLFFVVLVAGLDSPLVLATLTTALLIGLWLDERSSTLVTATLVTAYVVAVAGDGGDGADFRSVVVVPFVYVLLWLVGISVRRALAAERASQAALQDALTLATASEERARFAREVHDSLAKSLQGISLSASALPHWVERDPETCKAKAVEVARAAATAVEDARVLMTGLRRSTVLEPLADVVRQVVLAWEARTGRRADLEVADVDLGDPAVRHDLLAALSEALENVHRHAGGCATTVRLLSRSGQVVLQVTDTGGGASDAQVRAAEENGHFGLRGMRERLSGAGGTVLWSSEPGVGTSVTFVVPTEVAVT